LCKIFCHGFKLIKQTKAFGFCSRSARYYSGVVLLSADKKMTKRPTLKKCTAANQPANWINLKRSASSSSLEQLYIMSNSGILFISSCSTLSFLGTYSQLMPNHTRALLSSCHYPDADDLSWTIIILKEGIFVINSTNNMKENNILDIFIYFIFKQLIDKKKRSCSM